VLQIVATEVIRAGVALPVASAKLGHRKVGITADLYGHLTVDDQMGAADAVDARLAAPRAKTAN
jgi:hypothetical protein